MWGKSSWHAFANFRGCDPDLFFLARGESTKEAKVVCAGCQVRDECLVDSVGEKFGIWGGFGECERRRIRFKRIALAG